MVTVPLGATSGNFMILVVFYIKVEPSLEELFRLENPVRLGRTRCRRNETWAFSRAASVVSRAETVPVGNGAAPSDAGVLSLEQGKPSR